MPEERHPALTGTPQPPQQLGRFGNFLKGGTFFGPALFFEGVLLRLGVDVFDPAQPTAKELIGTADDFMGVGVDITLVGLTGLAVYKGIRGARRLWNIARQTPTDEASAYRIGKARVVGGFVIAGAGLIVEVAGAVVEGMAPGWGHGLRSAGESLMTLGALTVAGAVALKLRDSRDLRMQSGGPGAPE